MESASEVQITFLKGNEKRKERETERRKTGITNKNNRSNIIGICVLVCLDVALLTSITIIACYIETEKQSNKSLDTDIFVSCKDITIHPDDDLEGITRKGKNNEICFVENRKTLDVLVGYFVDHWLKQKLAKDDRHFTRYKCKDNSVPGKSKPAIKLMGLKEKQTGGQEQVFWESAFADVLLADSTDMVYDEQHGFIEIKKTGLYQIYTQVVLNNNKITNKWKGKGAPYIHQHFVSRREAGREQEKIILKASNSYCSCKAENQTVTSYLSGAFHLVEGDRLDVKVREREEIVPIAHMNFFGAYML